MPTSRGSNLWGDSPTVLPLREAESDSSGLEWKEEREELVSSVMEDRKGVLSEVTVAGVGPRGPVDRGVSAGGRHAGHQAVAGLRGLRDPVQV